MTADGLPRRAPVVPGPDPSRSACRDTRGAVSLEIDPVAEWLVSRATRTDFESLAPRTVHAANGRVIDTLGALCAGWSGEPCRIARQLARRLYPVSAATVLGTRQKTTLELAAFVNGTTARFAELNDTYHVSGRPGVHASDVITPLLSVAEVQHSPGADLVAAIVVAYDVCIGLLHAARPGSFDVTNYVALATAVGAARLLRLTESQTRNCVSLAAVSNAVLARVRLGEVSMWKAAASGQAARSGIWAALLAAEGMEAPNLPFAGAGGWLEAVGCDGPDLDALASRSGTFGVERTIIKPRGACGKTIPSILAAEKAHRALGSSTAIRRVLVETYADAKNRNGTGRHHWHPTTRETADHSIPYVVAATLVDGTIGPRQFDDEHLADPRIRHLMDRVEVVEEPDFTRGYAETPCVHRTRVRVWTDDGSEFVGESGGEHGEISDPPTDSEVERKFAGLAEGRLGRRRIEDLLATLWRLDEVRDVADLPPLLAFEEP